MDVSECSTEDIEGLGSDSCETPNEISGTTAVDQGAAADSSSSEGSIEMEGRTKSFQFRSSKYLVLDTWKEPSQPGPSWKDQMPLTPMGKSTVISGSREEFTAWSILQPHNDCG